MDATLDLALGQPPRLLHLAVVSVSSRGRVLEPVAHGRLLHIQYLGWALLGEHRFDLHPGWTLLIPPGCAAEVHATAWDRHHVLAEFQPRGRSGRRRLPLALPLGAWSEYIAKGCAQACACWPGDPPRATAAFWEVLFRIAEVHAAGPPTAPAALERARTWIEAHLGERITPSQVATAAGLSRAHLLRLFRAHEGTTIAGHIRRRRARRAHHLLVQSDLPVREIARRLGIPDLQAFNKTMRRELGRSPRRLRPPA